MAGRAAGLHPGADGERLGAAALIDEARRMRSWACLLRRESTELRDAHRRLARRAANQQTIHQLRLGRWRTRRWLLPSPWSRLRFEPIGDDLDRVLTLVPGGEARGTPDKHRKRLA